MSPESENPLGSPETRPLWIIAISLAAIAVCLILITIRIQLDRWRAAAVKEAGPAPIGVSFEKPDRPPVERRTFERPRPEIPALETAPSTPAVSAPVSNVEPAVPPPVPAYGGFAAEVRALLATNGSGGIVGRVILRGNPPDESPIDETTRPPCLDHAGNPLVNPLFKVSSEGALAEVIVTITAGLEGTRFTRPPTNHMWTFTNCQIYPFISVVHAGQLARFIGVSDPPHLIQFAGTRGLNPVRPNSALTTISRLSQSTNDLVQMKCVQHPWETAYFAKFNHPFFAITDTNGNFAIPSVPAGTYTLQAMHPGWRGTNEIKQLVSVGIGETPVVNFFIDAPEMKMSTRTLSAQR